MLFILVHLLYIVEVNALFLTSQDSEFYFCRVQMMQLVVHQLG